jgi:hypothetical protein
MSKKPAKLSLKRHKGLDKLYHEESNLVIKSKEEPLVVGRIENDTFIPLDDETLDLCSRFNMKYDETLVEVENQSASQPDGDVEDTEQQAPPSLASEEVAVASSPAENKTLPSSSDSVYDMLMKVHTIHQQFVSSNKSLQTQLSESQEELEKTKKELQEVKQKLKGVLSLMQSQL